jgi:hypothetical protein
VQVRLAGPGLSASNATRQLDAGFRQAAKEFPHRENIDFLEFVIVAEFELIGLGHDQSLIRVFEDSLLLQSIGAPPAAHSTRSEAQTDQVPVQLCQLTERFAICGGPHDIHDRMVKDDHYTTEIRSSAIIAVILARSLPRMALQFRSGLRPEICIPPIASIFC